jgi:hypothetical protein
MTTLTLEQIEAQHAKLGEMIAAIKAAAPTTYRLPESLIELKQGEHYAGVILDAAGEPSHHLILLPGDAEDLTWSAAIEWAKEVGGELPTRQEQAMLYANLKGQFQAASYWSSEQHASHSDYAWFQGFGNGYQGFSGKSAELRARAVRRLTIK